MKAIVFLISISMFFIGCKEEKKDPTIEFLEKVASLKDYAEYLKNPKAKAFREKVEKESKKYYEEFWSLIPEKFQIKPPIPAKNNSFYQFEKFVSENDQFDTYYDADDFIKNLDEDSNFEEVEDYLRIKYEALNKALSLITDKFQWIVNEGTHSKAASKLRSLIRILNLKFLVETYKGNWNEASNILDQHIFFLDTLEHSKGDLIIRLLSFTAHNLTYDTVIRAFENKKISPKNIDSLFEKFKKIKIPNPDNFIPSISYNLETVVKLCSTTKVSPKEYLWIMFYPITALSENPKELKDWFDSQYDKREPLRAHDLIKFHVEFHNLLVADLNRECYPDDMKTKTVIDALENTKMENFNNYFSLLYLKSMFKIKFSFNSVETRNSLVGMIADLRKYEIENNKLPATLKVLYKNRLDLIPKDLNFKDGIEYYPENREVIFRLRPNLSKKVNF